MNVLCVLPQDDADALQLIHKASRSGAKIYLLVWSQIFDTIRIKLSKLPSLKALLPYEGIDPYVIRETKDINQLFIDVQFGQATIYTALKSKSLRFLDGKQISDISHYYMITSFLAFKGIRAISICCRQSEICFDMPVCLQGLVDKHKGKRAFIVGNGPSLNRIDMRLLKDEITFGSNRVHIGFERWGFNFNYWGIIDRLQIEENVDEWERNIPLKTVKFFPFEYVPLLRFDENQCPINFIYNYANSLEDPRFDNDPDNIYLGYSVTHALMQIAIIMGCNPVILIGMDHNYPVIDDEVEKNQLWTHSNAREQTHFDPNYTQPERGRRFVIPRLDRIEKAMENARKWADTRNISIINATPDSKLKSFDFIKFEELF